MKRTILACLTVTLALATTSCDADTLAYFVCDDYAACMREKCHHSEALAYDECRAYFDEHSNAHSLLNRIKEESEDDCLHFSTHWCSHPLNSDDEL